LTCQAVSKSLNASLLTLRKMVKHKDTIPERYLAASSRRCGASSRFLRSQARQALSYSSGGRPTRGMGVGSEGNSITGEIKSGVLAGSLLI
jgi:hypothetical protein